MSYDDFLTSIQQTLAKNGYPEKRVALPLERMYEVAHGKGLNFNKALELMAERGIAHEKTVERIIFFPATAEGAPDLGDMLRQAQAMFASMSPEERAGLQDMVRGMSDAQREELVSQARAMGLKVPEP